jgi:hypothetical protein
MDRIFNLYEINKKYSPHLDDRTHLKGSKYVQIEWYYGKNLDENYKDFTLLLGPRSLPPRPFEKHGCVTFPNGTVPIMIRMQVTLILCSTMMKIYIIMEV